MTKVNPASVPATSVAISDRVWSAISHIIFYFYVLLLPLTGTLIGSFSNSLLWTTLYLMIPPFLCFLVYKAFWKHSEFVADHSWQALVFQLIVVGGLFLAMMFGSALDGDTGLGMLVGMCLMPLVLLPFLPLLAAIQAMRGIVFRYPLIGKLFS